MLVRERSAVVRGGFTLMEVLVVMAIIVVLASLAVPLVLHRLEESKVNAAKIGVRTIAETAETYKVTYGEFPTSLAELVQPPNGGLPYLKQSDLLDPWNREYQYAPQGQHNAVYGKPDVWSLGPRPNDPNGIIGNW